MAILTKKRNDSKSRKKQIISKSRKQKNVSKSRKKILKGGNNASMKAAEKAAMKRMRMRQMGHFRTGLLSSVFPNSINTTQAVQQLPYSQILQRLEAQRLEAQRLREQKLKAETLTKKSTIKQNSTGQPNLINNPITVISQSPNDNENAGFF